MVNAMQQKTLAFKILGTRGQWQVLEGEERTVERRYL